MCVRLGEEVQEVLWEGGIMVGAAFVSMLAAMGMGGGRNPVEGDCGCCEHYNKISQSGGKCGRDMRINVFDTDGCDLYEKKDERFSTQYGVRL